MKKQLVLLLGLFLMITMCGCSNNNLSEPATNLEFWIAENVDDFDFSNHQAKYGIMGGYEYYGLGYTPTLDENGEQIDPERCVIYTITNYPDYSNNELHITRIYITDPDITLYGLTIESTFEEFENQMKKMGFETKSTDTYIQATKGKYTFTMNADSISIHVEVTNKLGIQY